jgi:hypothetical protein
MAERSPCRARSSSSIVESIPVSECGVPATCVRLDDIGLRPAPDCKSDSSARGVITSETEIRVCMHIACLATRIVVGSLALLPQQLECPRKGRTAQGALLGAEVAPRFQLRQRSRAADRHPGRPLRLRDAHDAWVVAPIAVHWIQMTSLSDALSHLNLSREG